MGSRETMLLEPVLVVIAMVLRVAVFRNIIVSCLLCFRIFVYPR